MAWKSIYKPEEILEAYTSFKEIYSLIRKENETDFCTVIIDLF